MEKVTKEIEELQRLVARPTPVHYELRPAK